MSTPIARLVGADAAVPDERLQSLWSGYGEIVRYTLSGADVDTVVVKRVAPPSSASAGHPRGWNTSRSHQRKLRSYTVESCWYERWSRRCTARTPRCFGQSSDGVERVLVLEDLDAAGFTGRRDELSADELGPCLDWLAELHASFVGVDPTGLWPAGTYWHLDTRPDELAAMSEARLRDAAPRLDAALRGAKYRTIVHGDAKVANFCFASDGSVAAVDFQYVGGGCGVQDVAYFLSSCLESEELESFADAALDRYFVSLGSALEARRPELDRAELEAEWRALYPIAWADFVRFLDGWAPAGHFKRHGYSARMTELALTRI
ncbi:MAG: phosphotransferase [Planctomycetes bacterium]|nr:phosphotransferase [Planctomycetota bacterium]